MDLDDDDEKQETAKNFITLSQTPPADSASSKASEDPQANIMLLESGGQTDHPSHQ